MKKLILLAGVALCVSTATEAGTTKPMQTCSDGSRIPLKQTCPPPPPPPPPPASLTVRAEAAVEGGPYRVIAERSGGDLSKEAYFGYQTLPDTATSPADFPARSGRLKFGPGIARVTWNLPTTDDTLVEGPEQGLVKISSTDAPVAIAQAEFTITDNDVAPAPVEEPLPEPAPEPKPVPQVPPVDLSGGNIWKPSPTADGEVPINLSEGDLSFGVNLPGTAAPDVVGAMRFVCRSGEIRQIDSLLHYKQPGKAHWHLFYGLSKNEADDTYRSMQTKDAYSTCMMPSKDPANRSAYWVSFPMLTLPIGTKPPATAVKHDPEIAKYLDAEGKLTRPWKFHWMVDHFQAYYKRRPNIDPACFGTSPWGPKYTGCVPIPNGINLIFGYDMLNLKDGVRKPEFQCIGGGNDAAKFPGMKEALAICADAWDRGVRTGLRLASKITAQDCWDPRWLDSPNHQDHASFSVQKLGTGRAGCQVPGSGAMELKIIPGLSLLESYGYNEFVHAAFRADPDWGVYLSSDEHLKAVKPDEAYAGRTKHGDFRMSWLVKVRNRWEGDAATGLGCLNPLKSCAAGNNGDGSMQRGGGAPWYPSLGRTSWPHPDPVVPVREGGYGPDW